MKRVLLIVLIAVMPLLAMAQSKEEIIGQIESISSKVESLECDFVQTKHLKLLNDKMISYGKMYYQQPNMLRWEYSKPYTYTFILNSTQVLLKSSQREDVVDINKNKIFKEIARMMMNSVVGSCLSDESTFDVSIAECGGEWVATLIPVRRDMKQMWRKLVLHFNRERGCVVKVEMHENSGDYTVIDLKNIHQNTPLDKSLFAID